MSYVDAATDPNAKPDPSTASGDYTEQIEFWQMVDAILGGEKAIKAEREKYLPTFPKEKPTVYQYRLTCSPFTNIYGDSSRTLASKPFSKPLMLKDGTPSQYEKLSENIDGQGNNLHVFSATSFKTALDKGIDWILVDQTNKKLPDNRARSKAEEQALGIRPYWVHVSAQQMRSVHSCFVDGVETIFEARIKEDSKELDGFKEKTIERIRSFNRKLTMGDGGTVTALEPATWTLWEKHTAADGKVTWVQIDNGNISIGIIPLVPIILTKRCSGSSWVVEPALRDLAYMQMTGYRQEANLEWVAVNRCFPIVSISGMAVDEKGQPPEITLGPNTVIQIPQNGSGTGPAGEVKFVESTAQSIAELRNHVELTRKEMRDLSMQPLALANITVTLSSHLTKKASSAVQAWAFRFQDAIEQALKYTAMWLGDKTYEPEIVIHTDFAIDLDSAKNVESILKAEAQGIISKKETALELVRFAVLRDDFDYDEDQQQQAEEQVGLQPEVAIDPATGALVQPPTRPKVISKPPAIPPKAPAPMSTPPTVQ